MANYNSVVYVSDVNVGTVSGIATTDNRSGLAFQDGKRNNFVTKTRVIPFYLPSQTLGTADTVNLCVLGSGSVPLAITMVNDIALGTTVAVQIGGIQNGVTTGSMFTDTALTIDAVSTAKTKTDLLTNYGPANQGALGVELTADTILLLQTSTGVIGSASNLTFIVEYTTGGNG